MLLFVFFFFCVLSNFSSCIDGSGGVKDPAHNRVFHSPFPPSFLLPILLLVARGSTQGRRWPHTRSACNEVVCLGRYRAPSDAAAASPRTTTPHSNLKAFFSFRALSPCLLLFQSCCSFHVAILTLPGIILPLLLDPRTPRPVARIIYYWQEQSALLAHGLFGA